MSRSGDAFNTVALVVLVFDLTDSGRGVAGVVMFEALPVLLIGPVAGLAADRMPRRRLMVGADVVRAVAAASLVVVAESLVAIYAVAFVLSAAAKVFNPAASSLLPDVVGATIWSRPTVRCGAWRSSPRSCSRRRLGS